MKTTFHPPCGNQCQGSYTSSTSLDGETLESPHCSSESQARQELREMLLRREGKPAPGEARRTVWCWRIPYSVKLSIGPVVDRWSDGGPYGSRENAIAAAHAARGQMMDLHGKRMVGRYELQTHEARTSQPVIEEAFPEKIADIRQRFPGLFVDQYGHEQDQGNAGYLILPFQPS